MYVTNYENEQSLTGRVLSNSVRGGKSGHVKINCYNHGRHPVLQDLSSSAPPRPSVGLVMKEFARRVLSRHITSSSILVVAPDAVSVAQQQCSNDENMIVDDSIGTMFIWEGKKEGHSIHAISSQKSQNNNITFKTTLDRWWQSFDQQNSVKTSHAIWHSDQKAIDQEKPTWILLAVFDLPFGEEDEVWQESKTFLEECTATYIVIAIHSKKSADGVYTYGGLNAVEQLLERRYKLQTLSVSHYHAEYHKNSSHNHVMGSRKVLDEYGPNALFRSIQDIKDLLRWGAESAEIYSNNDLGTNHDQAHFTVYLFATQGLDLAIPSPSTYLVDHSRFIDPMVGINIELAASLKGCPEPNDKDQIFDISFEKASTKTIFLLNLIYFSCSSTLTQTFPTIGKCMVESSYKRKIVHKRSG
jgi:hypothetical protein